MEYMSKIEGLLNLINIRKILNEECFFEKDLDGILDKRDKQPFDGEWVKAYKQVEAAWGKFNASKKMNSLKEKIRKESFLMTSIATEQHEIVSYVSDDFDLICKHLLLGSKNKFIDELLSIYLKNKLPKSE